MVKFDKSQGDRVGYERISIAIMDLIEDGPMEVKKDGA
jgi:hypothetical protein